MVTSAERDMIVNAIHVLRKRRVRPNLKKIHHLICRKNPISEKKVAAIINALVDNGDVLRAHFKGAISYRIPAHLYNTKPCNSQITNNSIDLHVNEDNLENEGVLLLKQLNALSESDINSTSQISVPCQNKSELSLLRSIHKNASKQSSCGPRLQATAISLLPNNSNSYHEMQSTTGNDPMRHGLLPCDSGSSSSYGRSSSANGSDSPSSRSTPDGSEVDANESCPIEFVETTTQLSTPRVAGRGSSRRGRPPLTSRAPSSRSKVSRNQIRLIYFVSLNKFLLHYK